MGMDGLVTDEFVLDKEVGMCYLILLLYIGVNRSIKWKFVTKQ